MRKFITDTSFSSRCNGTYNTVTIDIISSFTFVKTPKYLCVYGFIIDEQKSNRIIMLEANQTDSNILYTSTTSGLFSSVYSSNDEGNTLKLREQIANRLPIDNAVLFIFF